MEKPRDRTISTNPLKRYIADPGAMGLFAFAVITFMSGALHCGWITHEQKATFAPGVFYGGLVQVIAGVLDLLRGEKVSGSTFVAFGFYWVSSGFLKWPGNEAAGYYDSPESYNGALGWYLFGWAFVAFASFLAVLNTSILQVILLGLVTVDFSCLAAMHLAAPFHPADKVRQFENIMGYFLVLTAALAYYLGVAFLLKGNKSPIQLPIWQFAANDNEDGEMYVENAPSGNDSV